jgi:hypothetical protein
MQRQMWNMNKTSTTEEKNGCQRKTKKETTC